MKTPTKILICEISLSSIGKEANARSPSAERARPWQSSWCVVFKPELRLEHHGSSAGNVRNIAFVA
jgi:hypothetical protein